ncbi:FepC ABC-type cobalamin/Fe3+-siderophores transport systems, ATPase components [Oxalobacteraceae bacterium]
MLTTQQLCISAGQRRLVTGLNWQVKRGEFWCVLGKNGAGKTSLLHTLAGAATPAQGSVLLSEQNITVLDALTLSRLRGLLLQSYSDIFHESVFNVVAIARTPHRSGAQWDTAADTAAVRHALQCVNLEEKMNADVTQLSGGERQRAAIAALIVQSPDLMLLDEPTAHQDVAYQLKTMNLLRDLAQKHAVIASCHDINQAARFATHVLLLGDQQHWQGPVDEVLEAERLSQVFGCSFRREGESWLMH